jgi:hypothetical protein
MTTDPWALLREARECVICPFAYRQTMYCACTFCALKNRIDAALAERQDKPPCSCGQPAPCMNGCSDCGHSQGYLDYCQGDRHADRLAERQDSATDVVEWRLGDDCDEEFVYYEAYPDSDTGLDVVRFKDGKWRWTMSCEKQGYCDTEAEAKSAAIAAARGMR